MIPKLREEDVEWIVNSKGELGVKIGTQHFFLYKGHSLEYGAAEGIEVRPVGKREFGECCHPLAQYKNRDQFDTFVLHENEVWPKDQELVQPYRLGDNWVSLPDACEMESLIPIYKAGMIDMKERLAQKIDLNPRG